MDPFDPDTLDPGSRRAPITLSMGTNAAAKARTEEEEAVISAELSSTGERVVRTSFFRMATRKPSTVLPTVDVLGLSIATPSLATLASWFVASAKSRGRDAKVLAFAEAALADGKTRSLLARADAVLAHGIGIRAYARLATTPIAIHDPQSTIETLLAAGDHDDPIRVFFVGPGAEKAAAAYADRAGVKVVGATDRLGSLEDVNEACAEVVVAYGADALEWATENATLLDVGLVVTAPDAAGVHKNRMSFGAAVAFLMRACLYLAFGSRRAGSLPAPR